MDLKIRALSSLYEAKRDSAELKFSELYKNGNSDSSKLIDEMNSILGDWIDAKEKLEGLPKIMQSINEQKN